MIINQLKLLIPNEKLRYQLNYQSNIVFYQPLLLGANVSFAVKLTGSTQTPISW